MISMLKLLIEVTMMKRSQTIVFGLILSILYVGLLLLAHFDVVIPLQYVLLFVLPFLAVAYGYQAKLIYSLVFILVALVPSFIVDWTYGFLFILPTLAGPAIYCLTAKKKMSGTNLIYLSLTASMVLLCLGAMVVALVNKQEFTYGFYIVTNMLKSGSKYLAMSLTLAFFFIQYFLLHFILRAYLKDKSFEYQKNVRPDFYLLALAILSIIATALPYHSEFYTTFCFVAAIVYGLPIALYGYQACSKLVIMLIVQAVFFLGISLPLLLLVLEGNQTLIAYLIIFVPVIAFAFYQLIMHGYNKDETKVISNGSKNRKPSRR